MSNANSIKRLNSLIAAISALTLDDLQSFTDAQVGQLRESKRFAIYAIDEFERKDLAEKEKREDEKRQKEQDRLRAERVANLGVSGTPEGLTALEWDYLKKGEKIFAIKSVRERTRCGLAEAKQHVEQVAYNVGLRDQYEGINYGLDVRVFSPCNYPELNLA